ncbi:hypothetical protein [Roseateles violae]|uniref:Uncharacterized protein n=1 Tax=Roseateles violae TaxID=3058042 RepID=A0ABT8DWU1_9BURK|nr:hypothetical protein [Pelomonas sp. PFR6]MDN3922548.1 hypothetical protein [Pelomonas sp. PFR6]
MSIGTHVYGRSIVPLGDHFNSLFSVYHHKADPSSARQLSAAQRTLIGLEQVSRCVGQGTLASPL